MWEVNELMNSSIQEEKLVQALEKYEKLIFSICYRIVGNYFDAQDLTQETFLSYYKALPKFDGQNEKGFLTKIATNKCLDYIKQAKQREIPSETQVLEYNSSCVPPPENAVLDDLLNKQLHELCASLKPPYNQVATDYYCHGHTAKEIAHANGKKVKTIQTQILRAKKMLQKLYTSEGGIT